jgi:hypothetical protein
MPYGSVHIPAGCTVSVGDAIGALTDMGVLKGDASIEITYDKVKIQGSKAETLVDFVKNMKAVAAFELYQLHLPNLEKLLDGAVELVSTDGVLVAGHSEAIGVGATAAGKFYAFAKQNGDKTVPTNIVITKLPATALVLETDYVIAESFPGSGIWGIVFIAGGAYNPAVAMTWVYDYTPAASKTLHMGDASAELTPKIVELSKSIGGKLFRARLWSATNEAGLTLSFPDSAGDDPASISVSLVGGLDTSRTAGRQLIEIYDEIGLTM